MSVWAIGEEKITAKKLRDEVRKGERSDGMGVGMGERWQEVGEIYQIKDLAQF